jgi:hypothetical protein
MPRLKKNPVNVDLPGSSESPTSSQSAADPSPNEAQRDRIAARAYELYQARGGSHGQDFDDWLSAEREVMSDNRPVRDE